MMTLLFMGTTEIIIIAVVIILLFGAKKIPELMKSLGKGVKSFKDGMNDTEQPKNDEPKKEDSTSDNAQ
ncbi:MAG: twin-arginine translocase TatA/TatE family subunit [Bacteroidales bacterium]|nr:twin-arginine translocase TatA/TatE family subunit [Bacteroidales bacterium]